MLNRRGISLRNGGLIVKEDYHCMSKKGDEGGADYFFNINKGSNNENVRKSYRAK